MDLAALSIKTMVCFCLALCQKKSPARFASRFMISYMPSFAIAGPSSHDDTARSVNLHDVARYHSLFDQCLARCRQIDFHRAACCISHGQLVIVCSRSSIVDLIHSCFWLSWLGLGLGTGFGWLKFVLSSVPVRSQSILQMCVCVCVCVANRG